MTAELAHILAAVIGVAVFWGFLLTGYFSMAGCLRPAWMTFIIPGLVALGSAGVWSLTGYPWPPSADSYLAAALVGFLGSLLFHLAFSIERPRLRVPSMIAVVIGAVVVMWALSGAPWPMPWPWQPAGEGVI